MTTARHCGCLIALGLFVVSPSALAAPPAGRVELSWAQQDPTCISAEVLAATVERTLDGPVFHGSGAAVATVTGSIRKEEPDRFVAHITLADAGGAILNERTVETLGECERLDESVAVVVALMIDSLVPAPAPLVIPESPPPPPPARPPPRATADRVRPPSLVVGVALGAGLSSSLLPGVTSNALLRGEIAPRGFVPLGLTMRAYAPAESLVRGSGGNFTSWSGEIAACPAWAPGWLRLGGCGGVGVGLIAGSPIGLTDGANPIRPVVFATVLPYGALRVVHPLWVRLEAGALFPLLRERWGYLEGGVDYVEVHRPAIVVPTAALALEIRTGS